MSGPGHNSTAAADQLRSIVQRVERLEEEKAEVVEQIREVLREAKGEGFDPKILRVVLRRRKMKRHDRQELDQLLELYEARIEGEPDGDVVVTLGGRG